MGYSPKLLLALTLQAFILGSVLGGAHELLGFIGALIGGRSRSSVFRKLEDRDFPWIGKALKRPEGKRARGTFEKIFTLFCDVFFCVAAGITILLLAYAGNNGRIRWFMLLGTLSGFYLFRKTVGKPFLAALDAAFAVFCVAWRYAVFLILLPFRILVRGVVRILRTVFRAIRRSMEVRRNQRFHAKEYERLLFGASLGFECMSVLETMTSEHGKSTVREERSS